MFSPLNYCRADDLSSQHIVTLLYKHAMKNIVSVKNTLLFSLLLGTVRLEGYSNKKVSNIKIIFEIC